MHRRLALVTVLATLGVAASAQAAQTSSNWAGYVSSTPGVTFRHVRATWTVPTATCTTGTRSYEASWVGIGGYHTTSRALEQIGTESDCSRNGTATYTAWYELVPSDSATIHVSVRAGDTIAASVAVSGHLVTLKLSNVTKGVTFTRTIRASVVDTTSADWIVEAPSSCSGSSCIALPLANFGTESFNAAAATTTNGITGGINATGWSGTSIALMPAHGSTRFGSANLSTGQATAGLLSPAADSFTVTYAPSTTTPPAGTPDPATSVVGASSTATG